MGTLRSGCLALVAVGGCATRLLDAPDLSAPADLAVTGPLWPMAGHDPQRTSRSGLTGPRSLAERWSVPGAAGGPPVIGADGTVYAMIPSQFGGAQLAALAPSDGHVVWSAEGACGNLALGSDGTVFADVCADGTHLGAFDGATGAMRWLALTPGDLAQPPLTANGAIFGWFGTHLAALAERDGTLRWQVKTGGLFAVGLDGSVIHAVGRDVSSLDPTNGQPRWHVTTPRQVVAAPSIAPDGSVLVVEAEDVGGTGARLDALAPGDGVVRWERNLGGPFWGGTPAVGADGRLIAVEYSHCFAFAGDGTPLWSLAAPSGYGFTGAPSLAADGTIYLGGGNARLFVVSAAGALVTQAGPFADGVVLGDGVLYVRGTLDGRLHALGP